MAKKFVVTVARRLMVYEYLDVHVEADNNVDASHQALDDVNLNLTESTWDANAEAVRRVPGGASSTTVVAVTEKG